MPGKVTDPELLAALEATPGPVSDPGVLQELEAAPRPPLTTGQKLINMIGRGAWALPGLVGLDYETAQAAAGSGGNFSERRAAQHAVSKRVDAENPIASGFVRGIASAPGEALAWAAAPEVKVAQGARALQKALAYGPRLGTLAGASEYGSTSHRDPADRAAGAAATGATAALLGGAMAGVLPNPAAMAPARSAAERLRETAINQGRKVLTGNAAPMATRKPLSEEAVQAAYNEGAIRPFGTVEGAAERLGTARESVGDLYGQVLEALEAKGVTGPNAVLLARQLVKEANEAAKQTLETVDPGPELLRTTAEELTSKVGGTPFASKRLGLTQAEKVKRTLQHAAASDYVKEGPQSLSAEARTGLASRIRQAIEDEVTAQAEKAPQEAAAFVPLKRRLGAIIEASNAANRGSARAANRQQFGLGSKVMASGALAGGSIPGAVGALVASTALRNRGPATVGWSANKAANLLRALAARAPEKPMTLTPEAQAIVDALRGNEQGDR